MKLQQLLEAALTHKQHGAPAFGLQVKIDHDSIVSDIFSTKQFDLPCIMTIGTSGETSVLVNVTIDESSITSGEFSHAFGKHNPGNDWTFWFTVNGVRASNPAHQQSVAQIQQQIGKNFNVLVHDSLAEELDDIFYGIATEEQ